MTDWQPIETYPKNKDDEDAEVARLSESGVVLDRAEVFWNDDGQYFADMDYEPNLDDYNDDLSPPISFEPTHWRLLKKEAQ